MSDAANVRSGFYGSFEMGQRPALLVIDFQRGFTENSLSPFASDCDSAIAATNNVIDAMRGIGPVLFTIIGFEKNMKDAGCWPQKCPPLSLLSRDTPLCELDPRLHYDPDTDVILYKTQASAFFGTALTGILSTAQCDTLIVAGATTSGCVRASVVDAMQYGFPPFVVQDCVADRSAAQHQSNLIDMASKYAEVLSLPELLVLLAPLNSITTPKPQETTNE